MDYPVFDLHWHGRDKVRDKDQSYKETLERSLAVAEAAGIVGVSFMPNTGVPLTSLDLCEEYLSMADACKSKVRTYVNIGLTPDVEQVKRAAEATRKNKRIIAMKAYWGRSTGDLSIVHKAEQYCVLEALAREGFEGVLLGHFEKESEMNDDLYSPNNPITWSTLCRPESAEVESFRDISLMAITARFRGVIHACHVSTAYVPTFIANYEGLPRFSCGITPQHFIFDNGMLSGADGVWYKCNPALRSPETRQVLEDFVLKGLIGIGESDHAPHSLTDKSTIRPASGVLSGTAWPYLTRYLENKGMSSEMIGAFVFDNAVRLFNLDLEPSEVRVDWKKLEELQATYPFDPFADFKNKQNLFIHP